MHQLKLLFKRKARHSAVQQVKVTDIAGQTDAERKKYNDESLESPTMQLVVNAINRLHLPRPVHNNVRLPLCNVELAARNQREESIDPHIKETDSWLVPAWSCCCTLYSCLSCAIVP